MPSVSCKIRSKAHAARWIEIQIGVDDASGDNFWKLTGKSAVSFPDFRATVGRWDPVQVSVRDSSGKYQEVPSIALISADPDPFGGFLLYNPGPAFYRLGCGQVLRGEGGREDDSDITYRMDFPCV
jgi:hypothetical protein